MHYLFGLSIALLIYCTTQSSTGNDSSIKIAMIKNETEVAVQISYRSNDPGFAGLHTIIPKQETINGFEETIIRAYGPQSEVGARAIVTFLNQPNPGIQIPIYVTHNEIIRIIALASGFRICNEDETKQYFLWEFQNSPLTPIEPAH